jgi:ankyrin repeat protein
LIIKHLHSVIFLLIAFTYDVNAFDVITKSKKNETSTETDRALLTASVQGKLTNVRHLLKKGASPNAIMQDRNKRSALILASAAGHENVVSELLRLGANVNYKDNAGLSAISWSALRIKNKVAKLLLVWNADINTHDNNGNTPLMYAVGTHNIELLKMLALKGADLDVKSRPQKMTPLLIAVKNDDMEMIQELLKLAANVNSANHEGYTPLMAAAESGQFMIVQTLISHGAKTNLHDITGMTATTLAKKNGHKQVAQLLNSLPHR